MQKISLFLEIFKTLIPQEEILKDVIKNVVKEKTGLILQSDDISIGKKTVFISVSGSKKIELLLKAKDVELEVSRRLKAQHSIR